MKKTLRFAQLMAILTTIFVTTPSFAVVTIGTPPLSLAVAKDEVMIYASEHEDLGNWGSQLTLAPGPPNEKLERDPWIWCESVEDPICDFSKPNYGPSASTNLSYCKSSTQEDCVVALRATVDSETVEGQFLGPVPGSKTFEPTTKFNLFNPGVASLIRLEKAPHSLGDVYLTSARVSSNYDAKAKKFIHTDLYVVVIPVSQEPDVGQACAWRSQGICGRIGEFSENVRLQVELRVTNQLGGWFLGRMQSPNIQVESFSSNNNRMEIDALPVQVPRFAYVTKKSLLTPADKIAVGNTGGTEALFNDQPARLGNDGFDNSSFGMISHFRSRVNDTATAVTSHWRIRTTSRNGNNPCLTQYGKVLGVVSTNATVYDGFAPQYRNGFLDYKVAGLHYLPDGKELTRGTYDLVMRSETARCLYGFTKAPISATISIVGEGSVDSLATTVVSERDGWIRLSANGFTFSEKNIKVKFSQPVSMSIGPLKDLSRNLSNVEKTMIRSLLNKAKGRIQLSCTGTFSKESDKVALLAKSKAACQYAKSLNGKLQISFTTKTSTNKNAKLPSIVMALK